MQSTVSLNHCYLISVVHQNTLGFQCRCSAIMRVTVVQRALNLHMQKTEVQA